MPPTRLDRGLYGSLIVEPKREERAYDKEFVLVLEDWATMMAVVPRPEAVQGRIRPLMDMMGMRRSSKGRASPGTPV